MKPEQRTILIKDSESGHETNYPIYNQTNSFEFSMTLDDEDEEEDDEDSEKRLLSNVECNNNYNPNNNYNNSNSINNSCAYSNNSNNNNVNVYYYMKEKLFNSFPKKYNRRLFHVQHGIKAIFRFILCLFSILVILGVYLPYSTISSRHSPLADWGYNTSRNLADYIFPENDTTLIEPKQICDNKVFLMIVVCSSVQNFAARQIIRETWGNLTEFNYSMFPVLHEHLNGQYLLPTKSRIKFYEQHFLKPTSPHGKNEEHSPSPKSPTPLNTTDLKFKASSRPNKSRIKKAFDDEGVRRSSAKPEELPSFLLKTLSKLSQLPNGSGYELDSQIATDSEGSDTSTQAETVAAQTLAFTSPSSSQTKAESKHKSGPTAETSNIFNEIVPNVKIVFLIGRSKDEAMMGNETLNRIHNEALLYNDIIQENFIDSYNNLTIKTIFTLKWFKKTCAKQVAFLMKCDDDTFVNIPNLLHYLLGGTIPLYNDTYGFYDVNTAKALASRNRLNATDNYLAGHLFCTSRPISDVNSKWYMPDYIFPETTYPMYLSGAGYIMTSDVVEKLYETALNTTFIHFEDVYLTGIVAAKAGIRPHGHPLFDYTRSKTWCSFKGILTQHELKDDSLFDAYNFVANTVNQCPPPGKYLTKNRLKKPPKC